MDKHLPQLPLFDICAAYGGCCCWWLLVQVDVKALKDLLWDSLVDANSSKSQALDAAPGVTCSPVIPFQDVIKTMPDHSAAGSMEDVSVHMCFICLLHLANEKGLVIKAKEDLCTLTVSEVPSGHASC